MNYRLIALVFISTNLCMRGQGFVNLDFEQAGDYLTPTPPGQPGGAVPIASGLPGWSGLIGMNSVSEVLQNNLTLGSASIDILGPHFSSSYIIDGSYSVMLQAGGTGSGTANVSIEQAGTIPLTAETLQFKASESPASGMFLVSFDGNTLSPVLLSSGPNYNLYGANVAPYAGETGQLEFTELFNPSFPGLLLDDISFSTTAVPEPSPLILTGMAAAMFAARRRWMRKR